MALSPKPGNQRRAASPAQLQGAITWWTSQLRRFQPDWIVHWGIGPMNVVAVKELKRNGIPLEKFITVNWINEVDINNIGPEAAKGLKRSSVVIGGGTGTAGVLSAL